jgi:hypothetical protein
MSALETEFFDLLQTSESRWTTLFIQGRTWVDIDLQNLASQAQINRLRANGARFATFQRSESDSKGNSESAGNVEPLDREETWRLWAAPGRRRANFLVGKDPVDVVIEGSTFWSNGHGRSITNGGKANYGHGQGDGGNLIRAADYVELLQVMALSEGMRIGRHTIDARVATLENDDHERGPGLHGLTIGDPEVLELSVDRERGVVLSASSWFHDSLFRIVEITGVEYDPNFDLDIFTIEPKYSTEWIQT